MTRLPPRNLLPFNASTGAADNTFQTSCDGYGLQPSSTQHIGELAYCLTQTLARCDSHAYSAATKAALRGYLCETELLSPEQCVGSQSDYRRHLLYVAPDKLFSIMAIVWGPGHKTRLHGHTSWGAVGVYEGRPYCENFTAEQQESGEVVCTQQETLRLKPLDLATVEPGLGTVHRIGNDSYSRCITIHIYGCDLLADPAAINFFLD